MIGGLERRDELRGALECWIVVGIRHGDKLPVIEGLDLNPKVYAEAGQVA